jgi:hypothetical protein
VTRRSVSPDQSSLFDVAEPEVRHRMDPNLITTNHAYTQAVPRDTQVAAAAAVLPRTGTQRARVLEAIKGAGPAGMTDQEVAVRLAMAENSVRPRRLELADAGLIEDSGERRETSGGNPAIVWIAPTTNH